MSYVGKMSNCSFIIYFQLTIFTQNSAKATFACLELTMSIYAHEEFSGITNRSSSGEMMTFVNKYTIIIRMLQICIKKNCPLKISFFPFVNSFIVWIVCGFSLLLLFVLDFFVSDSVENSHVSLRDDERVGSFNLANLIDGPIENRRRARSSL